MCFYLLFAKGGGGVSFFAFALSLSVGVVLLWHYAMFDASSLFGAFCIIPALERAYEITGNAAETFEALFAIRLTTATAWTDIAFDDTSVTTDWVTINWMVDGAIANASFFHVADNCFESFDVI